MKETLNHWHIEGCPLLPRIEFWPFLGPLPLLLTLHTVKNHRGGGAEGEPGGIARERRTKENGEKTTQRGNTKKTTKKDTGAGQTMFRFGVSVFHDTPRTPNVHISGHRRFKHHQNSTEGPPREGGKNENCGGRGNKKTRNFGPPTLRGPTLLWSINSTSKNWPKSKLAEVDHDLHFWN